MRTRTFRYRSVNSRRSATVMALGFALLLQVLSRFQHSLFFVSLAHLLLGSWVFLVAGGRHISAVGIYSMSGAVFLGVAGIIGARTSAAEHLAPLSFGLLALSVALIYLSSTGRSAEKQTSALISLNLRIHAGCIGVLMCLFSLVLRATPLSIGPLAGSIFYVGLLFTFLSVCISFRRPGPLLFLITALFALLLSVYLHSYFQGGGRLVLASLGIAFAFLASSTLCISYAKVLVLVLAFPFIGYMGLIRAQERVNVRASISGDVIQDGEGLGSVASPLQTFSRLIEADTGTSGERPFPRLYGRTFLASSLVWVPRSIWTNKPAGFGLQLTEHFSPEYVRAGHSMAALAYGEWYANFGFVGLIIALLVSALGLRFLDTRMRLAQMQTRTFWWSFRIILIAIVVSGIPDYFWGGTFTFAARSGLRVLVLSALFLPLWLATRLAPGRTMSRPKRSL